MQCENCNFYFKRACDNINSPFFGMEANEVADEKLDCDLFIEKPEGLKPQVKFVECANDD